MTNTQQSKINQESKGTKVDQLKEDKPITGQNYFCVSFISPEGVRNTTVRGLKIRGVFDKYEDAQEHAKKLQEEDPAFHIYVGEMGKWLPWDPNPDDKNKVKDNQYYEEELQKLVKGYEDNRERAKKAESDRKKDLIQKSLQQAKKNQNQVDKQKLDAIRKKVQQNKKQKPTNNNTEKTQQEDKLMLEKERLNKNDVAIKQNEDNLRDLDSNLSKLKEIYNKMQQKNTK